MKRTVALTLTASTLFLAGCCTDHKSSVKWEYKGTHDMSEVKKLTDQGWILEGPIWYNESGICVTNYVMKRQKQ
jgi:hypothetical protein